jgi:biopolymer transport protein ExbB/TolQ
MNLLFGNIASFFYGKRYITKGSLIQIRWFALLCVFFFLPTILGLKFVGQMMFSGEAWYLLVFASFFVFSLYVNARVMSRISYEIDALLRHYSTLSSDTDFDEDSSSVVAIHIKNLNKIFRRSGGQAVSQDSLIEILHAKLKGEESMVVLFSNLMITLGLLGTISGLISMTGGIGNSDSVLGGVSKALGGMGTAFYTTLLGSMLGGITLKVLHFYVDKKIDLYVLSLAEIIEIRVIPQLKKRQAKKEIRDVAVYTMNVLKNMGVLKEGVEV